MHRLLVWSLALAGCVGTPAPLAPTTPPVLAPFAAASQFVPNGMVSFAFLRGGAVAYMGLEGASHVVLAGRDFEMPKREGIGDSRTIEINDFGAGGMDAAKFASELDATPPTKTEGGVSWWHFPAEEARHEESWYVLVDDRFVLCATHHDLLLEALQRRGSLAAVFAPFGPLPPLPETTETLVCNLPRPGETHAWGRPVPTEPMLFAYCSDPWRLLVFSRTAPSKDHQELLEIQWQKGTSSVAQVDQWRCETAPLRRDPPGDASDALVVWMFFGWWVFV